MSVQIAIICNRCGAVAGCDSGADRKHAWQIRAEAKGRGWATGCYSIKDRTASGSLDFCQRCILSWVRAEKRRVSA